MDPCVKVLYKVPGLPKNFVLFLHFPTVLCFRRGFIEMMASDEPPPDWLPPGWKMTVSTRLSGESVGRRDKYYINPDNGQKFRSKKEVLSYLGNSSSISATSNSGNQEVCSRKRHQPMESLSDGWITDTKSRLCGHQEKYYIKPENELKFRSKLECLPYSKTSNSKDVIHIIQEEDLATPIPDSKKESNETISSAARSEKNFTIVELNSLHNGEASVEWKRTKQRAVKTCKRSWSCR